MKTHGLFYHRFCISEYICVSVNVCPCIWVSACLSLLVCPCTCPCVCVWPLKPFINAELTWTCSEHPVPQPRGHSVCLNYSVQGKTQTDYCVLNASKIRGTRNDIVPEASIVQGKNEKVYSSSPKIVNYVMSFPTCWILFPLIRI